MVSERGFMIHRCIPCGKMFSFVPRSRSSCKVKIKYQGDIFQTNLNIGNKFCKVSDRAFIFLMCFPCDKTFSFVKRSRSSVKVKSNIKAIMGALEFHKSSFFHIFFYPIKDKFYHFSHNQTVICKGFDFGLIHNFLV